MTQSTAAISEITLAGRTIPRIGLGTNRLTDNPPDHEFLRAAVDAGVRMIDTAHLYTSGDSERAIGAALAPYRDDLLVATKGGYNGAHPDVLRRELEQSLKSLRIDRIALHYLHRIDPEVPLAESVGALADLRDAGKIEHVAISNAGVEEIGIARGIVPIVAVQNEYNLGSRDHDEVIDFCEREGIAFVPYFPLRGESKALGQIASRRGATPNQVKLAWHLARSPVVVPIPGTRSIEHLRENLAALELELSPEDLEQLA